MSELSKKVKRQLKKSLGDELVALLEHNDSGSSDISVKGSDLLKLMNSVQKSYDEYSDRLNVSYRNLEISSQELNSRHDDIKSLNQSMESLLESLGEGYLTIDSNGVIGATYSSICSHIFGQPPEGLHFDQLLGLSEDAKGEYDVWLKCAFQGIFDLDNLNQLGPARFESQDGRHYRLSYRFILDEDEVKALTVITNDITLEIMQQAEEEERLKRARILEKILKNRTDFVVFLQFVFNFVSENLQIKELSEPQFLKFKLDLHTIKGSAGFFFMTDFVETIQEQELILKSADGDSLAEKKRLMRSSLEIVSKTLEDFYDEIEGTFGSKDKLLDTAFLSRRELIGKIEKNLEDQASREEWILTITGEPVNLYLEKFSELSKDLAKSLSKELDVEVTGPEVRLIPSYYTGLLSSFIHIIRNCIDHGIETPEQRLSSGKSRQGKLSLSWKRVSQEGNWFLQFLFADDGQGFDLPRLREKLVGQGHPPSISDDEVVRLTLVGEVSSRDIVTEVSGFGLGMSSVYSEASRLGGDVQVSTVSGEGSEFIVTVPEIIEYQDIRHLKAG